MQLANHNIYCNKEFKTSMHMGVWNISLRLTFLFQFYIYMIFYGYDFSSNILCKKDLCVKNIIITMLGANENFKNM